MKPKGNFELVSPCSFPEAMRTTFRARRPFSLITLSLSIKKAHVKHNSSLLNFNHHTKLIASPRSQALFARSFAMDMKPAPMPKLLYGTAWKKDATADLVLAALKAGFRGIDTAAQPVHYNERLVGAAVKQAISSGIVKRGDVFVCRDPIHQFKTMMHKDLLTDLRSKPSLPQHLVRT